MNILGWVMFLLPLVGCGAVVGVAMTKVREKNEQAAVFMAAGAGGYILFQLARRVLEGRLPPAIFGFLGHLVFVAGIGAVVFGLMKLQDDANPKLTQPLPPQLATLPAHKPNVFLRGFWGFFGAMGMLAGGLQGEFLIFTAGGLLALGAVLYGSYWVDKQGPLHLWAIQRRPELIIWSYVHSLTVVNRRYGTRTVHWSAQLGLSTGSVIGIPADGEAHAQQLAAAVYAMRPGILIGYSPDNMAKFKAMASAASAAASTGPSNPGGPGGIQSF
ncbi:MAG: hypothetical protein JNM17_38470 [Archangium sp.]|nr:hypothetical protein [Archangium sp.]